MSTLSFQGVSTGLATDSLISAIISNESGYLNRLQNRKTANTARSSSLKTLSSSMTSIYSSLASLVDALDKRSVTTTDADGTYATATATGATEGSYDVSVSQVATKGKISSTMVDGSPTNLAVSDPSAAIFTSSKASFAVRGTDGVIKAFELTNNSLNGLRDAINASGAGVTATIVNTGSGSKPYQLVVSAEKTGTGVTNGVVTLAAIDNQDSTSTTVNSELGITSGTISGTFSAPTDITGGLTSSGDSVAKDSIFTVNGIQLTRKTNEVTDAVDGVTFKIKKGSTSNSTTLTVENDKTSAETALKAVLDKYNALVKSYKTASTAVDEESATYTDSTAGTLAGDSTAKLVMEQLKSIMRGSGSGLGSSAYSSLSSIGVKTASDGTLSLDTTAFRKALDQDPAAVRKIFTYSGTSTSSAVSVSSGGAASYTGNVSFNITNYVSGGEVSGNVVVDGTTYALTGTNGKLTGAAGTPLEGLTLSVIGTGSGTLTLSRGLGQTLQDKILDVTSYKGSMELARTNIEAENKNLDSRVNTAQVALDRRKEALKKQYDQMEATVAELKSLLGAMS